MFNELFLFYGVAADRIPDIFFGMALEKSYYKVDQFVRTYQELTGYGIHGQDAKKL